jgi:hypothetical protein
MGNRLYLVFKSKGEFSAFSAELDDIVHADVPQKLIPDYYVSVKMPLDIAGDTSEPTWFIVKEQFKPAKMEGLHLLSSGRSLADVVAECRTSLILVV